MATYITVETQQGIELLDANQRQTKANRQRLAAIEASRRDKQLADEAKNAPVTVTTSEQAILSGQSQAKIREDDLAAFRRGGALLLLHMDGQNSSTVFIDSGALKLPVTATGTVTISTQQAKFNQAGKFETNYSVSPEEKYEGGYLSIASDRLTFGNSDFTIEFWIYADGARLSSFDQPIIVFPSAQYGGTWIQTYFSGVSLGWVVGAPEDNIYAEIDNYFTYDEWHHIAIVKQAGVVTLFVDGVLQVGNSATVAQPELLSTSILIGGWPEGSSEENVPGVFFGGYLDEVRVMGKAMYLDNFTLPSGPYR